MYLVKTPFWLRWLYPSLTWRMPANEKTIYLTFDDGPIPVVTPFVLETLKKFRARATFFCIGDNVRKYPEIYRQLIEAGHRTGNHTYNHLKGWDTPDGEYLENVLLCHSLVGSDLFRPPYGRGRRTQYDQLMAGIGPGRTQFRIVMWDVLSGDFDVQLSPEGCLKNVIRHARSGSIVVFHDSLKAFDRLEYVLPRALEYWHSRGYAFKALI
ncbi:MAG TPA: polysaccharide deacetylase family protein [Sphingobacteriaceae bacterium]